MGAPRANRKNVGKMSAARIMLALVTLSAGVLGLSLHIAEGAEFNVPAGDTDALIAAIESANATPGADVINLGAGTYSLTNDHNQITGPTGLPSVTSDVTIDGAGKSFTTITRQAGSTAFRIFHVAEEGSLTVRALKITNGLLDKGVGDNASGGAIFSFGKVKLEDVSVENNSARSGGGLFNRNGSVVLRNCTVSGNSAEKRGGGIENEGDGRVLVLSSTVTGNQAETGAGIRSGGKSLALIKSTVANNIASKDGGGIWVAVGTGLLLNSTVSGNSSGGDGGGVRNNFAARTSIINSTVSGNTSTTDGGGVFNGVDSGTTLVNATVAYNSAARGGGIADNGGTLVIRNSLIGRNSATGEGPDCRGTVVSTGSNLIGDTSDCSFVGDTGKNVVNVDPALAPLGDVGGPTYAHALLPGSPARDAGDDLTCVGEDQRDYGRPTDGNGDDIAVCDIGAYEAESTPRGLSPDPFLCYKVKPPKGTASPGPIKEVYIADEFEAKLFDIHNILSLCLPTSLNDGGISDEVTHLTSHKLRRSQHQAKHLPRMGVTVRNAFGTVLVDTRGESRFAVPAAKDLSHPVPAPDPESHAVDRFLCYKASAHKGAPDFAKRGLQAVAVDQFDEIKLFNLRSPTMICNSADKEGEGEKNPSAALACYRVSRAPGQPPHERRTAIHVADEFGDGDFDSRKESELCVPSLVE